MRRTNPGACLTVVLGLALHSGAAAPRAAAQASRAKKSVYGKLESVNARLNGIFMTTDDGKRLAWRFEAPVVAEIQKVEVGSPLIVIYRQVSSNDKRVTAVAFPGAANAPTYVNLTGGRVVLRSAPMVDGACSPMAQPVQETTIPTGGMAEVVEGCWCCSDADEACTPGNKSGVGRALLVSCFE